MIIFISGPISNNPNYREHFKAAQDYLEVRGYIVLSPTCLNPNLSYDKLMTICRTMIDVSDAVYMLRNWTISPGACDENTYAMVQNKQIIYEE